MTLAINNVASNNILIDAMLKLRQWDPTSSAAVTYSFPENRSHYPTFSQYVSGTSHEFDISGGSSDFPSWQQATTAVQVTMRSAIATQFSAVSNIQLQELSSVAGQNFSNGQQTGVDLSIAMANLNSGGQAFQPGTGRRSGDVWFDTSGRFNTITKGDNDYRVVMHELGHAIGLRHPHEGVAGSDLTTAVMPTNRDSMEFSIMTYRMFENAFLGVVDIPFSYPSSVETFGFAQSLMILDIQALQYMYGANFEFNSDDTTYSFSPETGAMSIDSVSQGVPGANRIFLTIWDGNGNDTYDFSNYNTALSIDLGPGGWSVLDPSQLAILDTGTNQKSRGNVFNALQYQDDARSLIENVIGGSGNDQLTGNSADNEMTGGAGANTLAGGAGNDTFIAAAGDLVAGETINGGADFDTLQLGAGVHSLVGVTLTGIESITLANAPSNTLTLGSAAQALLVTAAPGANDTVILDGFLTWPEQQALAAAGVEHVRFTNANGTNTVNFAGGVLQTVEVDYLASNLLFKNATLTYNPALQLTSARTLFDSSIEEVTTYVDGTRTTTVKTDTAGGTEQVWAQQTFTFTPAGALASLDQDNDDGSAQRVEYGAGGIITRNLITQVDDDTYDLRYNATGTLTQSVFTDLSLTAPFTSYTNDFTGGALSKSTTVFENGLRTVTNFSSGLKTSYEQYDDADVFSYSSLLTTYAANGSTIVSTVYTQDSGARSHHAGVGGATLTGNSANDSMTGALGAADVFVFAPGGGNDFVSNFENGVDQLNLAAFGFANFAAIEAIATGGTGWTYLSFADGGHLMINGLSRSALDTNDVIIA